MVKILTATSKEAIEMALEVCENLSGYTTQQALNSDYKNEHLVETYYNLKTKQFWFYYGLILELSPSKAVAMMLSVEDLIAYNEDEIIVKELTQEELIEEGYLS